VLLDGMSTRCGVSWGEGTGVGSRAHLSNVILMDQNFAVSRL